jgi:hypothetical protein
MAEQENAVAEEISTGPKYPHPKILLMDMPGEVEQALRRVGYAIETGTFGRPLRVTRDAALVPVPRGEKPPNVMEQEIVIVDCANPPAPWTVEDEPEANESEMRFWQSASDGVINPRPLAMNALRVQAFDRILEHGGVFIAFLDERLELDYVIGELRYRDVEKQSAARLSSWNFLEALNQIGAARDHGTEYTLTELGEKVPGVRAAMKGSSFRSSISAGQFYDHEFLPLARNKYDQPIAAIINPHADDAGLAFLFPRVNDPAKLVTDLLTEFLPRVAEKFFPHIQRSDWVREPPYELAEVQALEQETASVEAKAEQRVKELAAEIEEKRAERSFLYELLTATDDDLVQAVKRTLEMLGFEEVRDVDREADDKAALREDLQIGDRSPTLLVEVKGIAGLPKESYSLQVDKYVAPRMREWDRTDVQGLTVINHQLGIPALERELDHVFQDDVITHAEARQLGLLTTWQLYRLARSYLRNDWQPEQVSDLLYRAGVIEPIPSHYELIGEINQFFEKANALTIDLSAPISAGDRLAYELPLEFEEESADSLQFDSQTVERAEPGTEIGIKTRLSKAQAKKGIKVYRVAASSGS